MLMTKRVRGESLNMLLNLPAGIDRDHLYHCIFPRLPRDITRICCERANCGEDGLQ